MLQLWGSKRTKPTYLSGVCSCRHQSRQRFFLGPDYTEILEVYKNTKFEELPNLFDITQKLVHKQGEILTVKMIECASRSWTRSSLAHDQAIKWPKAEIRVYSDSVLCLGKMADPADANRRWEGSSGRISLIRTGKYLEWMEKRLSSGGIFSQDLRHWKSSRRSKRICKIKTLNLDIAEDELSSCQFSMTWTGQRKEIQKIVFRIPNMSRITRRDSREDTGRSPAQEMNKNGTECTPTNPEGKWDSIATGMVRHFTETGHPVFKGTSALNRGILKRKGGRDTIHFDADSSNTGLLFRTIHSANQLRINGAVSSWCEEVAQWIPGQNELTVEKSVAKENEQLLTNVKPQEVNSLVQTPRSNDLEKEVQFSVFVKVQHS